MDPRKCFLSSVLCLLALVGSGSGQAVNGLFDGSALFELLVTLPAQPTVQWSFNSILLAQMTPGRPPRCRYENRCEMYSNGSLRLDNLTFTDQGGYSLQVTSFDTDNYDYIYHLKVYRMITDAPVLSINSSTPNGLTGGTYLDLQCDAGNQNVTTYTFYRDGKTICSETHVNCNGSSLHFQPITDSDTGTYICTIENPFSKKDSSPLQLTVLVPVSGVTLTSNTSELIWPGIDSVYLNCSATGTNISYSWTLQGAPLPLEPRYHFSQNDSVLTISPVSAKDNGTFNCTARNSINEETSNGVKLNLASPVSGVILTNSSTSELLWVGQDSVILHCSAQGSNVNFTWSLNGQTLLQDPRYNITSGDSPPNSKLTISELSKNDVGPFTCTASNRLNNETSSSMTLNLAWHPDGDILCKAEKINENVQLGCSWPEGRPAANVTLEFQSIMEKIVDKGENSVTKNVSLGNVTSGTHLSCSGDQLGQTSNCTLSFDLPQSPGHDNNKVTEVEKGKSIELVVGLVANGLSANFLWYHYNPNRTPIPSTRSMTVNSTGFTSTLRISDANEGDNGKYECEANNFIGTKNFFFNVNVTNAPVPPPPPAGLDGGEIAGIVLGVLAAIAIIAILAFFLVRKK